MGDKDIISHRGGVGGTVGEAAGRARRVHGEEGEDVSAADESDAFEDQNSGNSWRRIKERRLLKKIS